jgi:hypothetical protein
MLAAFTLLSAAPAHAAGLSPQAQTGMITVTAATTATVDGQVNPEGQSTTYGASWALASSDWCQNDEQTGTPTASIPVALPNTDTAYHPVSVQISGLIAGDAYCVMIAAANASGSAQEDGLSDFTAGAPSALNTSVALTGASSATVTGTVNPAGQITTYQVGYGPGSSVFCQNQGQSGTPSQTTTAAQLPYSDATDHDVTVNLTGLAPGDDYCAELIASNASASATDTQSTNFTAGSPTASTDQTIQAGPTSEQIDGTVNPTGQTTTYYVQYDLQSSDFCQDDGTGSATYQTAPVTLPDTDPQDHQVTIALTGLTAGQSYCAAIVASNTAATTAPTGVQRFTAGQPDAYPDDFAVTGATTGQIDAQVGPAGQTTSYHVDYDLRTSVWCESFEQTGVPGNSTTPVTLSYTDATDHDVTIALTGLTAGQAYCAQLVATNPSASATNSITFIAGLPAVSTLSAQITGSSTATITGEVNPAGQTTTYNAQYDLENSDFCQSYGQSGTAAYITTAVTLPDQDATLHDVSINLVGLQADSGYCVAIVAQNASGTTTPDPTSFTAGAATASTWQVETTGPGTVTLSGTVNPGGQSATYYANWAPASSDWCQTDERTGTPTASISVALPYTDTDDHDVTVTIGGLSAGQSYCAELVAATGSVGGGQVPFTVGAPTASTDDATATGYTTATVAGTVNPAGQSTTYRVDYGLQSSAWCEQQGTTDAPSSTTPVTLPYTDATDHDASVNLTDLTAGTDYCAQLVAVSSGGSSYGGTVLLATDDLPLTVSVTGSGEGTVSGSGVSCAGQCDYTYDPGATLTLTATPAPGSVFAGWSGACSGTGACQLTTSAQAQNLTATFTSTVPPTGTVVVALSGTGTGTVTATGISCPGSCTGTYPAGTQLTLTATPAAGSTFAGWSGACTASGACQLTTNGAVLQLTATFTSTAQTPPPPGSATVEVALAGTGTGTVAGEQISCPGSCTGTYSADATVTLTATAAPGSTFAGWSGACTGTSTCQLDAQGAQEVTATFSAQSAPPAAPQIAGLRIAPASFKAARSGPSTLTGKASKSSGASVSYTDSEASRTTFTILQTAVGTRKGHGACSATKKRHGVRCTYTATLGSFTRSDTTGANTFTLTGTIGGRRLSAGTYQLRVTVVGPSGQSSAPQTITFRIHR